MHTSRMRSQIAKRDSSEYAPRRDAHVIEAEERERNEAVAEEEKPFVTMSQAALILVGVGVASYLVFKSSDDKAEAVAAGGSVGDPELPAAPASVASPVPPGTKTCLNGLVVPLATTCMRACATGQVPETAACPAESPREARPPRVITIASSPPLPLPVTSTGSPWTESLPLGAPGLPTWLQGFPLFSPEPDPSEPVPIIISPADALVFIQGFTVDGHAVYQGIVHPSVVLRGTDVALVASNIELLLSPDRDYLSSYFSSPFIEPLETPQSFVLVWSTDAQGHVLAWWLMNWSLRPKRESPPCPPKRRAKNPAPRSSSSAA